jgi:SAM-dependent methyltransferase
MFDATAEFYDGLYEWKDYPSEVARIGEIVSARVPHAETLLDVACGTGKHLELLQERFEVAGIDLQPELVQICRDRLPGGDIREADMVDFDLGRTFDVVTNLFSSIGYVVTIERLRSCAAAMAKHLSPRGVMLVEPWFTPDRWMSGHVGTLNAEMADGTQVVRMMTGTAKDSVSRMVAHYLIGSGEEIRHLTEEHALGLFTVEQYIEAFERAGLAVDWDPDGLMGRGLIIATK